MRTLSPPCSYTRWLTPPSFIFHNHQQLSSEENPPLMLASATIQLGQAGQGRGQAGAPAPEWVTQGPLSARVWRGQSGSHTDPSLLLPHNGIMITGQEGSPPWKPRPPLPGFCRGVRPAPRVL